MDAPEPAGMVRPPVAAGSFYAGSPGSLAGDVDAILAEAAASSADRPGVAGHLRGVITPHAGYRYSGPIAATAYGLLAAGPRPARLVILGPSHFEPLWGLSVPSHRAWQTPLGEVAVDVEARQRLVDAGAVMDDRAHRSEHSIEVQLPFIQRCFPGVAVLPVAVGWGDPGHGAEMIAAIMAEDALLIVSTDLSHYHDASTARRLDARTAQAIEALDLESLHPDDACGVEGLRVGLAWAARLGYHIALLDLRNSADTAGDPVRVVGYGAFAITATSRPSMA